MHMELTREGEASINSGLTSQPSRKEEHKGKGLKGGYVSHVLTRVEFVSGKLQYNMHK